MQTFVQLLLSGLSLGCIYGLVALGFVIIYKATETINFAQGELMMLGAFLGWALIDVLKLPFVIGVLLSVVLMAAFGMLIERVLLRPVIGQPAFSVVMLTFGIGYMARGGINMIPGVGTETHMLTLPYRGIVIRAGEAIMPAEQLVVIGTTLVLTLGLYCLFRFTRIGVAMQAASQNQLAAFYMGIPVKRINMLAWGLAAGIATIGGLLLAPFTFVHANMGFIGLKAFPAAVIGGFGSLPGAIVGGLSIGVVESLSGFYLPEGFKDIAAYVMVLIVLAVRPQGLLGGNTKKKV
ncbi:MAG: branched-chain amino acid ABC transporter permease [Devosia sp.]